MKILYIAHERRAAQVAAHALRRIAPDVGLTWAQTPGAALGWMRDNRDAHAVIVDAGTQTPGCDALLEQVRGLGVTTPIAVIAPEHLERLSAALTANRDALVDHERNKSDILEAQLREIEEWRWQAQQRLAQRQAQHDAALGRTTKICTALQERLLELEDALHGADERRAAQTAATEQLARREAELSAALAEAVAVRTAVERRLSDAEAARQDAQRHAAEELAAANERYAALENRLTRETTVRTTVEDRLAEVEIAREDANQKHAAELASLTTRLVERQAYHDASLARTSRISTALQSRLLELEAAIRTAAERHAADTAATERLALRESELGAALADAIAARTALEHRLSDAETASQRAAADLTLASARRAAFEEQLSKQATARSILEQRVAAAETARRDADQQHATEVASLTRRLADVQAQYEAATVQLRQRETELGASLAEAIAARTAVEDRSAEAEAAHQHAQQRAAAELAGAAERYAGIEDRLSQEVNARTTLEERLDAAETARHEADRQHATELASLTARLAEAGGQYDEAVTQRAAVEQQLTDATTTLAAARRDWQSDVTAAAELLVRRETELNAALTEAIAARAAVENNLDEAEAAHQHAHARAVADLADAAARHASLEEQMESSRRDIARLQRETDGLRRQLDAMRTHAAALRLDAQRVPMLQLQLDASQKENRRQFERAPYGLCECTRDGAITRVNHSLARLLGCQRRADLQAVDFVESAFERAADLHWLLERALQTDKVESVETTFKTRDRRRLFVRLHAQTRDASVVIAVEDLTRLCAVEQRLREAQRMEAVGRVASEVAVTCDTLLRDVSQGGRQWLAGFASDTPLRQRGELLLGDVTRAAGLLRQFAVYGHKQISNVEPVSMQRVLRDMAPVLKRVLGDDITLVLPKTTDRFDIDVDADRVERILVNVANYARERMPHGGRVKIQLATTVVDRRFLASHPTVRPGVHVLMAITEIRGAVWPALPIQLPIARAAHAGIPRAAPDKPGMDLGPLMALISDLGGHLWMSAEPAGNMTLQIHLPKRTQDDVMEPVPGSWSNRGRQLARWFRH